jgi:hypothetical protein
MVDAGVRDMVRVMVCPLGTVVAGLNTRTGATDLPETWVVRVMDAKLVIADEMIPDATAVERVGSALVDTFTSPDTCATPMVKPESVIVTASLSVEAPRVIVKVVACVLGPGVPLNTNPELVAVMGFAEAKKPLGYCNTIVLPTAREPPAVGLKPKVTVALLLPATRSAAGIEKEGRVTCEVAVVVKYIPNRMTRLTFILRFSD